MVHPIYRRMDHAPIGASRSETQPGHWGGPPSAAVAKEMMRQKRQPPLASIQVARNVSRCSLPWRAGSAEGRRYVSDARSTRATELTFSVTEPSGTSRSRAPSENSGIGESDVECREI
jgi:hypothetical protein